MLIPYKVNLILISYFYIAIGWYDKDLPTVLFGWLCIALFGFNELVEDIL